MCREAFKNRGQALQFVPDHYKTYELCFEAVKCSGWNLQFAPEQHRDAIMCQTYQNALQWVPEQFKNLIKDL